MTTQLEVKNFIIIKNRFLDNNLYASFIKYLSRNGIYGVVLSIDQLNDSMHENYYTSRMDEIPTNYFRGKNYPKTVVFHREDENFKEKILQKDHEFGTSKYIWLTFNGLNESSKNNYENVYIPYNCEYFVIREINQEFFAIKELYHDRLFNWTLFESDLGTWSKKNGLAVPELDIYKRRSNLNGTVLNFGIIGLVNKTRVKLTDF